MYILKKGINENEYKAFISILPGLIIPVIKIVVGRVSYLYNVNSYTGSKTVSLYRNLYAWM